MNQTCKVCGEPAAGFHFGAFTCEGCKSFFGRSYNNLGTITDCKNNNECIINKKNRTACKSCRLRKCLVVGMSKSGSRYGRRSNWFKIHCLLQEQQQQHQHQQPQTQPRSAPQTPSPTLPSMHMQNTNISPSTPQTTPPPPPPPPSQIPSGSSSGGSSSSSGLQMMHNSHHNHHSAALAYAALPFGASSLLHLPKTREELMLLGLDDYKGSATASPSVSSPESHNSDSSVEVSDARHHLHYHPQQQQHQIQLRHSSQGSAAAASLPLFLSSQAAAAAAAAAAFLPHPHSLLFGHNPYSHLYPGAAAAAGLLQPVLSLNDSINANAPNNVGSGGTMAGLRNHSMEALLTKRVILDAVLHSQRSPANETPGRRSASISPIIMSSPLSPSSQQTDPLDLSLK